MSNISQQDLSETPSPFRRLLLPGAVAAIAFGILLNLGLWQLDRLAWKEALIAKVQKDIAAPAVPAPGPEDWPTADPFKIDYRHVSVTGHYLDGVAYYYTSLGEDAKGRHKGPGYMIYSPFETVDGWTLMINRGFIPQQTWRIEREAFTKIQGAGETVTLSGLLRMSEQPNWTTPATDPDDMVWFARDTINMSKKLDVPSENRAPFSIDLDAEFSGPTGVPQAGETVVRFKNDHLGYALTWFGLAATLLGVFAAYAFSVFRSSRKAEEGFPG